MCEGEPCRQWVAVVGNRKLRASTTPEVFLSGALHGDETIGPASVLETVAFLVERYGQDPWVTQLVDTRTVVAIPMANAEGGSLKMRGENRVDTNRDFAFDTAPDKCMKTMAARAINEVCTCVGTSLALCKILMCAHLS
jgi:predicted deacylase